MRRNRINYALIFIGFLLVSTTVIATVIEMEKNTKIKIITLVGVVGIISGFVIFLIYTREIPPTTLPEDPISDIDDFAKGDLIYFNPLAEVSDVSDWKMEGPGNLTFSDDWMKMESPDEEYHHVFWCPEDFSSSFIAEWSVQLLEHDLGLIIIFFAAQGINGEDVLDPSLAARDGSFGNYTKGDINNYHISYYANAIDKPGRLTANMRKNSGFHWVQEGRAGIPIQSTAVHKITLVKNSAQIVMFLDGEEIINWTDDGKFGGEVLGEGKMGFRQMQQTSAQYQNFSVWNLN